MRIAFRVNAEPLPQPRQRFRTAKVGGKVIPVAFRPKNLPVQSYKDSIRKAAREVHHGPPLTGPLKVDVVAVFPRLKSMRKKTRPMLREWKSTKPDNDNMEKAVWDALTGLLWHDDSQIADNRFRKFFADGQEIPHLIVIVQPIIDDTETYQQTNLF